MKIFCEDFKMHFEEYCDGELPDEMREACDDHIRECGRCHAFYYDHRHVDELMMMLPRETAPEGFADRVMSRWREEQAAAPPSFVEKVREFFRSPRLVFLSEVAALAILVVGAFYFYNFHLPGNTAAVNDGSISSTANLPKPTATPAAGAISANDEQRLANLASDTDGIASTIGPNGLIEIARQSDTPPSTDDIDMRPTPVRGEMPGPDSAAIESDALAALANFDRYFAAVTDGPPSPRLYRNSQEELNFWGMHDIKKGMRDMAVDTPSATPRIMLHKVYRAAQYPELTGADVKSGVEALFAACDGRLTRAAAQTQSANNTVMQFTGWVPQASYQLFQSKFVNWQPEVPSDVQGTVALDVPGVSDDTGEAADQSAPASAMFVTVILTFVQ